MTGKKIEFLSLYTQGRLAAFPFWSQHTLECVNLFSDSVTNSEIISRDVFIVILKIF